MNDKPMKRPWLYLTAGLLLAAIAAAGFWLRRRAPMEKERPVCLLTGFEPFGGSQTNVSWEMLKPLAGQTLAGYRIVTVQLPVLYDDVAIPLYDAILDHNPELVICFGEGGPLIEVELLAHNSYGQTRQPDNRGRLPPRQEIIPGGPSELPTQLPAQEILRALKDAHIGAKESRDAGGYLCNECFYRLMAHLQYPAVAKKRGFVHVPPVGLPGPEGGSYTLEKLQQAVRIIIEQTARAARGA
ncbi:MAG: pyroglutamyl-peptidase I [Planctomycetota bacterium]